MAMEFFLISFNERLVPMIFLSTIFTIIDISWIYLFFISISTYLRSPKITPRGRYPTHRSRIPYPSKLGKSKKENGIQFPFVSVMLRREEAKRRQEIMQQIIESRLTTSV
jgi:hypothetical protein